MRTPLSRVLDSEMLFHPCWIQDFSFLLYIPGVVFVHEMISIGVKLGLSYPISFPSMLCLNGILWCFKPVLLSFNGALRCVGFSVHEHLCITESSQVLVLCSDNRPGGPSALKHAGCFPDMNSKKNIKFQFIED